MISINIYYKGENGNAKRFAEDMKNSGILEKIRNESGNLGYDYFFSANDDETVLLIDKWENQSAIDAHHASNIMLQIVSLRDKYGLSMRVERYVLHETPLLDMKYIKS